MSLFSLLLLVAAGSRVVLDDTVEIPRGEWRYVEIKAKEPKAVVNCEFEALSTNAQVRVVWVAQKDLESFRAGHPENILAASAFGAEGKLRHFAPASGDFAMVLENQSAGVSRVAKVKVKVWLESAVSPRYASPERRLVVIAISGVVFFGIVSVSAFQLRKL